MIESGYGGLLRGGGSTVGHGFGQVLQPPCILVGRCWEGLELGKLGLMLHYRLSVTIVGSTDKVDAIRWLLVSGHRVGLFLVVQAEEVTRYLGLQFGGDNLLDLFPEETFGRILRLDHWLGELFGDGKVFDWFCSK